MHRPVLLDILCGSGSCHWLSKSHAGNHKAVLFFLLFRGRQRNRFLKIFFHIISKMGTPCGTSAGLEPWDYRHSPQNQAVLFVYFLVVLGIKLCPFVF